MDLKEFWDSKRQKGAYFTRGENAPLIRKELGLLFWGRGGKDFVLSYNLGRNFNELVVFAKELLETINTESSCYRYFDSFDARDFLDCLACLGEERVKELIKGVN